MGDTAQHDMQVHLPKPPGTIRSWFANHPRVIDISILVCYLIGALPLGAAAVMINSDNSGSLPFTIAYGAVTLIRIQVCAVALFFRRSAPLLGLIGVTFSLLGETGPLIVANSIALWFLLYAVPVYRSVKSGWIGYAIALAGYTVTVVTTGLIPSITSLTLAVGLTTLGSILGEAIVLLVVLLVGINLGNRRRYLAAVIDRAHQLARERDQLARLAVAEERSRIARELHDIVAHSVSVMIALSEGSARAIKSSPEQAADALRQSAETGRTALAEMRQLLGALQVDETAELAPQPGLADIPEMLDGFRNAGLRVTFVSSGTELSDRLHGLAVYRVVQEGLTNVLRYAGEGALADVSVQGDEQELSVTVRDYGRLPGFTGPTTGLGSGRGLAGLAERVRVFGGTIESGPVLGETGWRLTATLPTATGAIQATAPAEKEAQ